MNLIPTKTKSRRHSKALKTTKDITNLNIENNIINQFTPYSTKTRKIFISHFQNNNPKSKSPTKTKHYLLAEGPDQPSQDKPANPPSIYALSSTKDSNKTRSSKLLGTFKISKDSSPIQKKITSNITKDQNCFNSPTKNTSSPTTNPSHKKQHSYTNIVPKRNSQFHGTQSNPIIHPHYKLLSHKHSCEKIQIECKNNENTKQSSNSQECLNNDLHYLMHNKVSHFVSSEAGLDYLGQSKVNQDNYVYLDNILGLDKFDIFGVLDGHGKNGHDVSAYVAKCIKSFFRKEKTYMSYKQHTNNSSSNDNNNNNNNDNGGESKQNELNEQNEKLSYKNILHFFTRKNYKLLHMFYNKIESELSYQNFDVNFSGTTCIMIHRILNTLLISNIGDSRAIIIRQTQTQDNNNNNNISHPTFKSEPLSNDHKPGNTKERKRIESSGGVVKCCPEDKYDPNPIMRVWLRGEKFPGIAIARTLGDKVAKTIGVVNTPEIKEIKLKGDECCIIVASDGIWEFLTNDKVKDIVVPFYLKNDPKGAVDSLITIASEEWDKDGCARDDITCVAYFFPRKEQEKCISSSNKRYLV